MSSKIASVALSLALVVSLRPISDAGALPPGGGGIGSCKVCAASALQGVYCSAALFGGASECWLEPQPLGGAVCKTSGTCTIKYPGLVSW